MGELVSFDDYISRASEGQKEIFYLCTSSRALGEESPYYEAFKDLNKEVLFMTQTQDEHVMSSLKKYKDMELVSIDSEKARNLLDELNGTKTSGNDNDASDSSETGKSSGTLSKEESDDLSTWFLGELGSKVKQVKVGTQTSSFPAIVTNFDSPAVRKMMLLMAESSNTELPMTPVTLEINPKDPIIYGLYGLRNTDPELAKQVAEQVFDNALASAGILDDPRVMVRRLNSILSRVVKN
ncbi:Heat shock protein 75 kDa, mitochondrial [Smittium mucronatum]|uniref:Heat shock protein 75 kDa, mitochondrial n=1 Tax=Smittium mucronatum TaxID=133383 RepID=A0A1R0GQN3_9FUNG|nr:Heat shock protein 75 kDa, mitochondrial [Smittium mucronatum]